MKLRGANGPKKTAEKIRKVRTTSAKFALPWKSGPFRAAYVA